MLKALNFSTLFNINSRKNIIFYHTYHLDLTIMLFENNETLYIILFFIDIIKCFYTKKKKII